MEHPNAGYILLQNPFELQHMFTINRSVNISNSIFRKIIQLYNISLSSTEEKIINNVGTGQVFNLPKSEIIIGNNISIELTSVALELEKLASKFRDVLNPSSETTKKTEPQTTDNKNNTNETSIIDLSECQEILKKKYQLPEDEILYIFKGDTFKLLTEDYYGPQVDYQLFSYSLGAFLPLNDCKEKEATVTVTNPFVISNVFSTSFQSKMGSVIGNGYDGLDSNSPFYRDISKINCERNENNKRDLCRKTKKILKIKLLILFAVSIILIGFFWYYVAAFCAVFKNSQGHYFINVLVAFIVCNIWPCVTSLIPPILRRNGIKNDSSCMYKASQIIAYI